MPTYDPRFYEFIKQSSIKHIDDVFVELITNSVDAYKSSGKKEKYIIDIEIEIDGEKKSIIIRDQAKGLTSKEIKQKLLTIGSHTAEETSRGIFGRGFKDSSVICNTLIATAFKDGKVSQVELYRFNDEKMIFSDIDAEPYRENHKIYENGLEVKLFDVNYLVPPMKDIETSIRNNYFLRNILREQEIYINLSGPNYQKKRITYEPPKGKKVFEVKFPVEGYDIEANFTLYQSEQEIKNPPKPDQLEYGILVCSSKSVYECSGLYYVPEDGTSLPNHRWNPGIKKIYGILTCDMIDKLIKEAGEGKLSKKNPRVIMDPSRRHGLDKEHPFIVELFKKPHKILSIALKRIQDLQDENSLSAGDIQQVLDIFGNIIDKYIDPQNNLFTWRSKEDHENLLELTDIINNADFDPEFLGVTKDQIEKLKKDGKADMEMTKQNKKKSSVSIKLTNQQYMEDPYDILYYPDQTIIKVNVNHSMISPFVKITEDNKITFEHVGKGVLVIGKTIKDAFDEMLVRQHALNGNFESVNTDQLNEMNGIKKQMSRNTSSDVMNNILSTISKLKNIDSSIVNDFKLD